MSLSVTLITLLGLEAAIRVTRRPQESESAAAEPYWEYDPLLGWRKKAGTRTRFRTPEYDVWVDVNQHGLRDPERGYEVPVGTTRILALGDSFVEAYGVPLDQTVTQVLERELRNQGCPTDVINAGASGYSTDQEYLFLKSEGVRYSPSVVLLFFYYNDVLFNARAAALARPKPVFVIEGNELVLKNVPVPPPLGRGHARRRGSVEERSALLAWIRERLLRGAPRVYNAVARVGLWPPLEPETPPLEIKVYRRRPVAELEDAWKRTALLFRMLARDVEAAGARLLAVYVPASMEVGDREWELSRVRYGFAEPAWDRTNVVRRLVDIVRDTGAPVLDLTPALAREYGPLGGPYYVADGHWNSVGHRAAAREISRFLLRQGWLPRCPGGSRETATPSP